MHRGKQRERVAEKFRFAFIADFADELDPRVIEQGFHDSLEVHCIDSIHLRRQLERNARAACDMDRHVRTLFR